MPARMQTAPQTQRTAPGQISPSRANKTPSDVTPTPNVTTTIENLIGWISTRRTPVEFLITPDGLIQPEPLNFGLAQGIQTGQQLACEVGTSLRIQLKRPGFQFLTAHMYTSASQTLLFMTGPLGPILIIQNLVCFAQALTQPRLATASVLRHLLNYELQGLAEYRQP